MTMNTKAKLTLDTAGFDGPMQKSGEVATATARAQGKAAKQAAQAQAEAAKYAADQVSTNSLRIVVARKLEAAAAQQMSAAHKAAQSGYLSEAEGARVEAAALQRLTEAKLKAAQASRVQAEASHKGLLAVREHIEGISVGGAVGENLMGIGAALGVAEAANKMRELVSASLEYGEAIQRASEKTGLEVSTLSTLHYAAAVTGGDFDSMTQAVAKMDKTIGTATEGNAKANAFLKSLGLDAKDLAGRTDGAQIAFQKFAEKLAATENPIRRVELATGLLGKAGAEQIPMLIELGENWETYQKKAADAGQLLDSKTAAQLAATQQRLKDLQQHIMGAGLAFTEGFIPGFNQMLDVIASGKGSMDVLTTWGSATIRLLAAVTAGFYGLASGAEMAFGVLESLVPGLGDTARKDFAAAKGLDAQALMFRDIAFNQYVPPPRKGFDSVTGLPLAPLEQMGDEDASFLDSHHLGGRKRKTGTDAFGGIGDLNAGSKAAAAQKKADEEALKEMAASHLAWDAIADRSKADEQAYWADRIAKMVDGAGSYTAAMKHSNALMLEATRQFNQATVAVNRENAEAIANFTREYFQDFNKTGGSMTPEADKNNLQAQGGFAKDYVTSLRARIDGERANADAIARSSIEMAVATGQMAKLDAAQAMATLHLQEYNDALEKLQDREDLIRSTIPDGQQPTLEQKAQLNTVRNQRADLNTTHTIQVQQDQLAAGGRDTSPLVGATDALDDFVDAARDGAEQMRKLVDTTLSGFNSEAVKALSGQKTNFGDFGAGVARSVAGSALQKGEGSILGMFGLGTAKKPTGARGDALHVLIDNPMGAPGSSLPGNADSVPFTSLLPGFAPGASSTGGSAVGSSVSKIFSAILPMLPGFADGGAIAPNTWAMVGERGPEPFFSGGGGTVIPNHKMADAFGGGGDTHFHVDARGSNDPAAVEAAVQRGIKAAAPHIAAAGVRAAAEQRMRGPSSRRG